MSFLNFKKLKLYKIFRDEEEEYVTLLINGRWIMPILEAVYGLGKSKYKRSGPNPDGTKGFSYNVIYVKRM